MTIVPASRLSPAEMNMLGTNVVAAVRLDRWDLSAVNRSLEMHGEAVDELMPVGRGAWSPIPASAR